MEGLGDVVALELGAAKPVSGLGAQEYEPGGERNTRQRERQPAFAVATRESEQHERYDHTGFLGENQSGGGESAEPPAFFEEAVEREQDLPATLTVLLTLYCFLEERWWLCGLAATAL